MTNKENEDREGVYIKMVDIIDYLEELRNLGIFFKYEVCDPKNENYGLRILLPGGKKIKLYGRKFGAVLMEDIGFAELELDAFDTDDVGGNST